ncbi:hypothetical protein ABZX98_07340 [Streptomyces sp. NPDC002992]|uniref:hypothetical protein n=1 Tax=Streptomyces sp. NPDC002992 TaxID=3154273 RepID=UPI0033B02C8B
MTSENTHPAGENAHFFFNRLSPAGAEWFADLCDEAAAKGPSNAYEFRRLICDLEYRALCDGVSHAMEVAQHFVSPNTPFAKWAEAEYEKYDKARATIIETGPSTAQTGAENGPPGNRWGASSIGDSRGADEHASGGVTGIVQTDERGNDGDTATSTAGGDSPFKGPGCGGVGSGSITVTAGGPDGKTPSDRGIGHQGTLFTIRYAQFRLTFPDARTQAKAEHKRLIRNRTEANRLVLAQQQLIEDMDLVAAADQAIENLANKHRDQDSVAGMLRAAGKRPEDLGLTERAVTWLDTQIKHAS